MCWCNSSSGNQFPAVPGLIGNSRPQRLKIAEPSGCFAFREANVFSGAADLQDLGSPLPWRRSACGLPGTADRFGSNPNSLGSATLPTPTNFLRNANRTSEPGLFAKQIDPHL